MKRLIGVVLLLTFLCLFVLPTAKGWNATGHEIIATLAYRQLSPKTRAAVFEVLQSHPDYIDWKIAWEKLPNNTIDLELYTFLRASVWPDQIKRKGNDYDHPQWHYVDYSYSPGHSSKSLEEPSPQDNILFGIKRSEEIISAKQTDEEERAAYVSWLIHMVGDIHQPLHCITLINEDFPKGDLGGNKLFVRPENTAIKLHSFWDGLLGGNRQEWREIVNEAIRLEKTSSASNKKGSKPSDWSLESYHIAIEKAYANGKFAIAATAKEAEGLPGGYSKDAKATAETQAVLSGYRLARELESLFGK